MQDKKFTLQTFSQNILYRIYVINNCNKNEVFKYFWYIHNVYNNALYQEYLMYSGWGVGRHLKQ